MEKLIDIKGKNKYKKKLFLGGQIEDSQKINHNNCFNILFFSFCSSSRCFTNRAY